MTWRARRSPCWRRCTCALRRFGVFNFPVAPRILHSLGVFPIRRHYYEPLWHPGDLRMPLKTPRSLPGLNLNEEGQLSLLAEFRYESEIARFGDTANPLTFSGHVFHTNNERFGPGDIDFYSVASKTIRGTLFLGKKRFPRIVLETTETRQ